MLYLQYSTPHLLTLWIVFGLFNYGGVYIANIWEVPVNSEGTKVMLEGNENDPDVAQLRNALKRQGDLHFTNTPNRDEPVAYYSGRTLSGVEEIRGTLLGEH